MDKWEKQKELIRKIDEIRDKYSEEAQELSEKNDFKNASLKLATASGLSEAIMIILKEV